MLTCLIGYKLLLQFNTAFGTAISQRNVHSGIERPVHQYLGHSLMSLVWRELRFITDLAYHTFQSSVWLLLKTLILLTLGAMRRELFLNDLVKEAQFLIWKKTGMHHPNSDDTLLQLMKI